MPNMYPAKFPSHQNQKTVFKMSSLVRDKRSFNFDWSIKTYRDYIMTIHLQYIL